VKKKYQRQKSILINFLKKKELKKRVFAEYPEEKQNYLQQEEIIP